MILDPDLLEPAWIEQETKSLAWRRLVVEGFPCVESTNDEVLARARDGAGSGLLVYAEEQLRGRGRLGRSWHSPRGAGIYFSLLVRPGQPLKNWPLLTHVSAVALVWAIAQASESCDGSRRLTPEIKWPNDVLVGGKKIAGILLETCGGGRPDAAAVIGVGVNVAAEAVPQELRDRVTSLDIEAGVRLPRRRLLIRFLDLFQERYMLFETGNHKSVLEEWRSLSRMWNGTPVEVIEGDTSRSGVTCGLTDTGGLRIRTDKGSEQVVFAGDVSVRLL